MSNGVTAWSYSRYADYQLCPFKFKLKHVDRNPIMKESSPAMDRGQVIHKLAEYHVTAPRVGKLPPELKYFADSFKQLRTLKPLVEQQWGFRQDWTPSSSWFGKDTWLRIITDATVKYDDDTVDVIDYKTGKMYGTNEEQVELFSCGPFMMWPEVQHVRTQLWYLDIPDPKGIGDNIIERDYTRKDFGLIKKDWTKRVQPMFLDKKFPPRPNDKCRWCPASKAKGGPCKF